MSPSDHKRKQERLNGLAGIYHTYTADLQRYIYGKVGELFLAEDLSSTVFLKALRWLREEQSIRPAHLLLGLLNEGSGIGAGLMRSPYVPFWKPRAFKPGRKERADALLRTA